MTRIASYFPQLPDNTRMAGIDPLQKLYDATSKTFPSEEQAVLAAAKEMYKNTAANGREWGGYIIGKAGKYRLAEPSIEPVPERNSKTHEITPSVAVEPKVVDYYRKLGYSVTLLHSHPNSINPNSYSRLDVEEGPSLADFKNLGEMGLKHAYVVTGDGDVVRYFIHLPSVRNEKKPFEKAGLRVIGDVDKNSNNGRELNGWVIINRVQYKLLDPHQIK
jgi:hypothetical protein